MSFRIAINGYGRIGRCILRAFYESSFGHPVDDDKPHANNYADLRIVAINDLADLENLTHLTKFDSTHGRFLGEVKTRGNSLIINKDEISISQIEHVKDSQWKKLNVDLVLECSGTFGDRHLRRATSKKWREGQCSSLNQAIAMLTPPLFMESTTMI